ncbi:MAG TPA: hypothetical protein VGM81_15000 [Burkholderiaceae bacterium]|jgi:hypothetical protein
MNIALPALIIFACLLPGFIFRSRLKLVESTSLDYSPFGRVVSESIMWAVALHTLWVLAFCPVHGDVADLGLVLKLLSSNLTVHGDALDKVAGQTGRIIPYFGSLYLAAFLVPTGIRKLISTCRLDRYGSATSWLFRFHDAPWYYTLTGADFTRADQPDFIMVTAIVDVAGQPILFKGVLDDFYFKSDGALDRLILEDARRRPLSEDKGLSAPEASPVDENFYFVDGDSFVIQYDQVITLNIEYVQVTRVDEAGEPIPDRPVAAVRS